MKKALRIRVLIIVVLAVAMAFLFSYRGVIPPPLVIVLSLLGILNIVAVWKLWQ